LSIFTVADSVVLVGLILASFLLGTRKVERVSSGSA
jgi:hypothetical protein